MGLDTSHDCWHGPYSAFMRWRQEICRVAGLPPLDLMEGFYTPGDCNDPIVSARRGLNDEKAYANLQAQLPIRWDCLKPSPLHKLLNHSDCDGQIDAKDCGPLADALEAIIHLFPEDDQGWHKDWRSRTATFIAGLRLAASRGEPVDFH